MTPYQLLALIEERVAEAKARQRVASMSFGQGIVEDVTFSVTEAAAAAQTIRYMQAAGTVDDAYQETTNQ